MLILPLLIEEDVAAMRKYDTLLKFISGAASLFYPASLTTQESLFKPSSADSASELLYSSAYEGMPDAQIVVAQWAHGAKAYPEALAWAKVVECLDKKDFLEERNGANAFRLLLAFERGIPSSYVSQAKTRIQELNRKCKRLTGCRQQFVQFLQDYSLIVSKRHPQADAAFALTWLGFQCLSAHLVSAPSLIFAEVLKLAPQNAVASAFDAGVSPMGKEDFDGLLNNLAPHMRQLGSIKNGISWH